MPWAHPATATAAPVVLNPGAVLKPVPAYTCPQPSSSSRRKRLWELDHSCMCPVVGVCIPLDVLRRLAGKVHACLRGSDDYEIHASAVAECAHRNRLSELLQAELERRYALAVQRARLDAHAQALAHRWEQAMQAGDVAGVFWAVLTHPRCDRALQQRMTRDLHMYQHQAGAAVRVDWARHQALLEENGVLARELAKAQDRCTRLGADKAQEMAELQTQLMRSRAELVGRDTRLAFVLADMQELQAQVPHLEERHRQAQRITQLQARLEEVQQENVQLRRQLEQAQRAAQAARCEAAQACASRASVDERADEQPLVRLEQQLVLCVGGRSGNVAGYRDAVERVGARFAHHDGGLEDNVAQLEASLAAADLVICQTGCISHNAYWRVKDHCKRLGKRCVFVENPSLASLERGLAQAAVPHTVAQVAVQPAQAASSEDSLVK